MFPKFALVVIEMYLSVLAKVRLPSSTPLRKHVEIAAQQDDVGALAGDIHGLFNRDADIGRMQGRRIVDAVAEISDRVPGSLQGADDPLLLLRIDFDEEIGAWREVPQRLVLEFSQVVAGEHRLRIEADGLRQMRRHIAIVSADHLDADAEPGEIVDRALRVRLGRVGEDQKAAKRHVLFVIAAVVRLRRDPACRHSQDPEPLGPFGLEDRIELGAQFGRERDIDAIAFERRADVEHVGERALGDDEVLRRIAVFRHDDGEPAAKEVVGDFVDLGEAAASSGPRSCPRPRSRHRAGSRCRSRMPR